MYAYTQYVFFCFGKLLNRDPKLGCLLVSSYLLTYRTASATECGQGTILLKIKLYGTPSQENQKRPKKLDGLCTEAPRMAS